MAENRHNSGHWRAPTVDTELDAIFAAVTSGTAYGGMPFVEAMRRARRKLLVAVAAVDETRTREVSIAGVPGFSGDDLSIPCHNLHIHAQSMHCDYLTPPTLPQRRWEIARRKFSLPPGKQTGHGRYVSGPYLLVGAYEPDSGVLSRCRAYPVWYSASAKRMGIVRSQLERAVGIALLETGAVSFNPVRRAQLATLQAGLGARWAGDIATYEYTPDLLIMPTPNHRVVVAEIFGIRGLRRYLEGKAMKKRIGLANPNINFAYLEGKKLGREEAIEWVNRIVLDASNGVWRADG